MLEMETLPPLPPPDGDVYVLDDELVLTAIHFSWSPDVHESLLPSGGPICRHWRLTNMTTPKGSIHFKCRTPWVYHTLLPKETEKPTNHAENLILIQPIQT